MNKKDHRRTSNLTLVSVVFIIALLYFTGLGANRSEAHPFAYVTNPVAGTISVIETNPSSLNFNKVVSTINVGGDPGVIVSVPDGSRSYISSHETRTITMIDTNPVSPRFNTVVSTLPVQHSPGAMDVTPDGTRVYVSNPGSGNISVIDANPANSDFNKVVSTISVPHQPGMIAITPDGSRAYVVSRSAARVMVIDIKPGSTDYHKVVSNLLLGGDPHTIAFTPDGNRAYIVSPLTNSVLVMNTEPGTPSYNQVVSIAGPCSRPTGIVFTPDGNHAYLTNYDSGTVSIVGTNPNLPDFNKVTPIMRVGQHPEGISITPDGSHIYVVTDNRSVLTINTATRSIINTLTLNDGLSWVSVVPAPNIPANVPPVADAGGPYTVKEGATAQLNGSATDPDFQPISFSWDLDNDGQFESPGQTVVFNAVNRDGPSVQTVVLKATDNGGLSSTAEATITVENAAPTLNGLVNNGPVDEGSTATVTAAATDPASDALTYQFDFNNDGVFEVSQASSSATHTFPDNGVFTVHARARDDDGGVSGTLSTVVTVKSISPTVKAGEDQSTQEGTAISFNGSFTDPGSDTHTYSWNFGDGSSLHTDSLTPSHTYRDNGIFTVTLTVTDDDGSVGSDSLTVTVKNIAPTIEAGSDREVNEGDTMGLVSVTFTDPGVDDTHTATIDWKDGSPVETGVASAGKVAGTHIYTDNGQFTPEICVTDDDGGLACDSFVVTVNNVAPTVHAGRDQLTEEGTTVAFSGSFTDPGADTHSYSWHFGDGSPAVTGSLAPVHTYIDNGTYTVTLTVTDDDGGSATDTAMVTVRNLPPVISVLASATVDEGTPLELELTASDNCRLDVVTLEASGLPDGARFSSTPGNPATGTLHWTPAFTQSGSYPGLTFTATDNDGGIDTRTINLIVNEKGQPVLAVTNLVDDTVTLIDQQLNGVVQTVKVGHHPVAAAFHNVWADDSNILAKLYVAERNADALSVLEPASNTGMSVAKVIPVGNKPKGVGVSPTGNQVWVANRNGDSLSVIEPATDTVIATIPLSAGGSKKGMGSKKDDRKSVALGFSPDDRYAYVVARNSGTLVILEKVLALTDPNHAVLSSVHVGNMPEALAVDPAGGRVYVADWNGRKVSVVDVSSPTGPKVLATAEVGKHPEGMALLSDGSKLYVTNTESDTVSVFEVGPSPFYLTPVKTISVGKKPLGIATTPGGSFGSGNYVYVANRVDDTVSVIDAVTDRVIATIVVGAQPSGVAAGIMPTVR